MVKIEKMLMMGIFFGVYYYRWCLKIRDMLKANDALFVML